MNRSVEDFIQANLPLVPVPFVPEIRLHKAVPRSGLGRLAQSDAAFTSPYWAHYWGGGLALARYILDHPASAQGKRVLDLGTGSGLVAIAAAMAGAREAWAADIDPYAIAAARLNARANGVVLKTCLEDLTLSDPLPGTELVTVGDLFYEADTASRVEAFLRRSLDSGADVMIGDPWRAFLPHESLQPIATFNLCEVTGAASETGKPSTVFTLKA